MVKGTQTLFRCINFTFGDSYHVTLNQGNALLDTYSSASSSVPEDQSVLNSYLFSLG